jgi:phosphatidylglycerophosphatase A
VGALEHLPGGVGIVADDVMAGIYTNVLLHIGGSLAG